MFRARTKTFCFLILLSRRSAITSRPYRRAFMPMFKRADAEIHYEVHGKGFPILLYAPGGLKSQMNMWGGESTVYPNGFPWMDPRTALADTYTVVAMDQRNAGKIGRAHV